MARAAKLQGLQRTDLEMATLNFPDDVLKLFMPVTARVQFFYSDVLPAYPRFAHLLVRLQQQVP